MQASSEIPCSALPQARTIMKSFEASPTSPHILNVLYTSSAHNLFSQKLDYFFISQSQYSQSENIVADFTRRTNASSDRFPFFRNHPPTTHSRIPTHQASDSPSFRPLSNKPKIQLTRSVIAMAQGTITPVTSPTTTKTSTMATPNPVPSGTASTMMMMMMPSPPAATTSLIKDQTADIPVFLRSTSKQKSRLRVLVQILRRFLRVPP